VAYRLVDPAQYQGKAMLVVGGGDSALEAAIALAEQAQTRVTLSYRGEAFSRVKEKNRLLLAQAVRAGRLTVHMASTLQSIHDEAVLLQTQAGVLNLPNDGVIVCTGGVLPMPLLQKMGVSFSTKFGHA
jgi:thioredoxin reductase